MQKFEPGADTRGGRRRVTNLAPDLNAESLAISPDGAFLTVAIQEQRFDLMLAENVPGLKGRATAP